jgi:hypothetical protein
VILGADMGLELRISEDFQLTAATGPIALQGGPAKLQAGAGVDTKAATKLGVVAGPFKYSWKQAIVDHTAPGSEKVFWKLSGAEFTQSDDFSFVVVLQVPNGVEQLQIAGALRAYHGFDPAATLGEFFAYFGKRLKAFFKAGAPTTAPPTVRDVTPNL